MKKFLTTLTAVLLSLCLCVGLAACGGGGGTHEGDHNTDDPYESTGEYHTVTFDSQGGSEVEAQTVLDGDYARQPSRPEKAGSYFLHWSEEIEGERFVFTSRIITKDMTLYAVWGEAYTVTFDTQDGSDIPAQYVSPNTSARNPDSPTRSGYHFLGWYTAAEGGIEWKWNDPVTGDITVYAHWEADGETESTASLEFSFNSSLSGYVVTGVGQESDLRIPATYQNRPVVGIGNRAFYNRRISSVELPASLVSIGTNAFTRTDLTSVTIPASVTTLGNYAFSECKSLTSVTFEAGSQLESIGQRAFADDPALSELTIPANVTSIGSRLIYNSGVATIHFLGTRSAWDAINKAENWNYGNTDVEVICSDGSASEPTDPEPTDPEPTDPEPTDPEPTDPEPTDPEPTDPEPTDPEPTDPEPTDPEPTDPEPTDPEPTDPEPTDPEPTDPEPTDPEPTDPEPTDPDPDPEPTSTLVYELNEAQTGYIVTGENGHLIEKSSGTLIRGGSDPVIPNGVKVIGEAAFSYGKQTTLTIPVSVQSIESRAIANSEIKSITFMGTETQWQAIIAASSKSWDFSNRNLPVTYENGEAAPTALLSDRKELA